MLEPLELQHIHKGNWLAKMLSESTDRFLALIKAEGRACFSSSAKRSPKETQQVTVRTHISMIGFRTTDVWFGVKKKTELEFCLLIMFAEFSEAHNRRSSLHADIMLWA